MVRYVLLWPLRSELKLILFHQESRTCENHNMVKFRALLCETSQHKKGTCSVSLRVPSNFAKWEHNKWHLSQKSLQASQMQIYLSLCPNSLQNHHKIEEMLKWKHVSGNSEALLLSELLSPVPQYHSLDRLIFRTAMLWCDVVVFDRNDFLVV